MSTAEWAVLVAATMLGTTVQAAIGYGSAFFLAPILLALRPAAEAVVALLGLGLVINLLMLYGERRGHMPDRSTVGVIFAAAVPGTAVGATLLQVAPKQTLQVVAGATIVVAALVHLGDVDRVIAGPRPVVGSAACGFVAGAFTTTTGLKGPALAVWLARHAETPGEFRDTVAASMLALNVLGAVVVAVVGGTGHAMRGLLFCSALLPVTLLGHHAGRWARGCLDAGRHRRILLAGAIGAGLGSVLAGMA